MTTSLRELRELRDDFRTDAIRRALDMAKACDAAARLAIHNEQSDAQVAMATGASAQAWAAVAALLAPNGSAP